eukprot:8651387-Pyramimonas_sp.AAC.1
MAVVAMSACAFWSRLAAATAAALLVGDTLHFADGFALATTLGGWRHDGGFGQRPTRRCFLS